MDAVCVTGAFSAVSAVHIAIVRVSVCLVVRSSGVASVVEPRA